MISLSSIVYADSLSCQYTDIETYENEIIKHFIDDKEADISEPFTSILDVKSWKQWIGYTRDYKFTVKNNLNYPLNLTVIYVVSGKSNSRNMYLDPFGYQIVQGQYHQDYGGLDTNSISINIHNILTLKEVITKSKDVCKKCDGVECLNDGYPCTNPQACGGKHCIEGYCSS